MLRSIGERGIQRPKTGREVTFPVNYRRTKSSDEIVIGVMAPDAKTWWRNFTGDGAPIQLRIGSHDHTGHARAVRASQGVHAGQSRLIDPSRRPARARAWFRGTKTGDDGIGS